MKRLRWHWFIRFISALLMALMMVYCARHGYYYWSSFWFVGVISDSTRAALYGHEWNH